MIKLYSEESEGGATSGEFTDAATSESAIFQDFPRCRLLVHVKELRKISRFFCL
jgi:hypothetical protein